MPSRHLKNGDFSLDSDLPYGAYSVAIRSARGDTTRYPKESAKEALAKKKARTLATANVKMIRAVKRTVLIMTRNSTTNNLRGNPTHGVGKGNDV